MHLVPALPLLGFIFTKKKKRKEKKTLLFLFQFSIPKLSFSLSTVQFFCPFSPFTNMAETFNFMRQIPIIGPALGFFCWLNFKLG